MTHRTAHILRWAPAVPIATVVVLVLAATLPMLLGDKTYTVMGGSMEPAIPLGAAVVVEKVPASELSTGDVITYQGGSNLVVTHRINSIENKNGVLIFHLKGDANGTVDVTPIGAGSVLGRVRYNVPLAGYLIYYAGQGLGRAVLMGFGGMLVAYWLMSNQTPQHEALLERSA